MADNTTSYNGLDIRVIDNGDSTYSFLVYNKVHGNTSLLQGNLTLTGAVQQLSVTSIPVRALTISANPNNAQNIFIGNSAVSTVAFVSILPPGSSYDLTVSDVDQVWVTGTVDDLVSFGGEF